MGSAGIRITNSNGNWVAADLGVSSLGIKGNFDVYAKLRVDTANTEHKSYITVTYGNQNQYHHIGFEGDIPAWDPNDTSFPSPGLVTNATLNAINTWVWFKLKFRISGSQVQVTGHYEQNDTDDYTTLASLTEIGGTNTLSYTTNEDVVQRVVFSTTDSGSSSKTFRADMDAMHIVDVTV